METLWEKIQFWKSKPVKLKRGVDYEFVDSDDNTVTGIGILRGKYAGVLYHYGKAGIVEEGELARLRFGYTIVDSGEHNIDDLTNDPELHTIMGDLLTEILLDKTQNETTRNIYSEEPDLQ